MRRETRRKRRKLQMIKYERPSSKSSLEEEDGEIKSERCDGKVRAHTRRERAGDFSN